MNTIKTFDVLPFQEGDVHIAVCPDFGTVDQGTTPEEGINNLLQTTHIYLQESKKANIYPSFLVKSQISDSPIPPLPQISPYKIITVLERLGYRKSSHCIVLKKQSSTGEITCVIPLRNHFASVTTWNILSSAGITLQEFLENL